MENKKVFHVTRSTKTGKTVDVGDFDTVEQAHEAMLKHYKETPKRGKFWYTIGQEELEDVGGVVYRKISVILYGDDRPYRKRFMPDELKALVG